MNFDDLVNLTHTRLITKSDYSVETVRDILTDVEIPELMKDSLTTEEPRRLFVRQVLIQGDKFALEKDDKGVINYRRRLELGLNGWISGNGTGKSTVLKVIVWALTGVKPTFKPIVLDWISDVAVEIEIIDDGIYTISYSLRKQDPQVSGYIYPQGLDEVINNMDQLEPIADFSGMASMKEAIDRFFGKRLGFAEMESVEWRKGQIDLKRKTVSWNVYAQALFIDADDYSQMLFPKQHTLLKQQHQITLNMYLGLDLTRAISRLNIEHEEAKTQRQFEKKLIEQTSAGVPQQISVLEAQLQEVEKRIAQIDRGNSATIDPTYVEKVQQKMATNTDQYVRAANIHSELRNEEQRIKTEQIQQKRIIHELEETIRFKVFLSDLKVERCPHCENNIPQTRVDEELASGRCRICHSELKTDETNWQEVKLKEAEKQLTLLNRALRKVRKELKEVEAQIQTIKVERQESEDEFQDLARQQQSGLSSELRQLLNQRGYLKGQLNELASRTEKHQLAKLAQLEERLAVFKEAHSILQSKAKRSYADTIERLENHTTELAKSFGVPHLEQVSLTDALGMIIKQSGRPLHYSRMEAGERLRLKIAFHLALLSLRVENAIGRHPAFLIIDAPGSAEADERYFNAIIANFTEIVRRFNNRAQILVASSKEEFSDMFDENLVERKGEGEFLF